VSEPVLPADDKETLRRQIAELRMKNAELQEQLMLSNARDNSSQNLNREDTLSNPDKEMLVLQQQRIEQLMAQVELEKRRSEDNGQQILMLQESLKSFQRDCVSNGSQTEEDPRWRLLQNFLIDIRDALFGSETEQSAGEAPGQHNEPKNSTSTHPKENLDMEQIQKFGQEIMWDIRARKNEMSALQSQLRIATSLNDALSTQLEEGTARVLNANSSAQSVDQEAEVAIWRDRASSLEEALKQREEDVKLARSQLEAERVRLQNFIQTFETRSADARVTELEGELAALRTQLQSLQREYDAHRLSSISTPKSSDSINLQDSIIDQRDEVGEGELDFGPLIGSGAFAQVHRGWWKKEVAIKKFPGIIKQEQLDAFSRESTILRQLNHPCIARFLGLQTELPSMLIVLEMVQGRNIESLAHERGGVPWDPNEINSLALQLADAMAYVHSMKVIHRDLKPSNVLVTATGNVKLIDFGLAIKSEGFGLIRAQMVAGTPVYLAPEVLREEPFGEKIDVYAFGIMFWEMHTQTLPWEGMDLPQMIVAVAHRNQRPLIPPHCPFLVAKLIEDMWAPLPDARPDFYAISHALMELGAVRPPRMKATFQSILAM